MDRTAEMVREFHKRNGYPLDESLMGVRLRSNTPVVDQTLNEVAKLLLQVSRKFQDLGAAAQEARDPRLYRVHLIAEELGELAGALLECDETLVADALGDLIYVVVGTAETFSIPLETVVEEIHASNMTKKQRTPGNLRMRDKGKEYKKPDIKSAVQRGREERAVGQLSARQLAGRCWTDPRVEDRVMDPDLAEVFAETLVAASGGKIKMSEE